MLKLIIYSSIEDEIDEVISSIFISLIEDIYPLYNICNNIIKLFTFNISKIFCSYSCFTFKNFINDNI